MPLLATLALNFGLGALTALAAARELRASPRPSHHTRAFRALAAHEILVAMPIAGFLLARFTDWMVSYFVDGARLPSALLLVAVLGHGALAFVGFALGAHLLREHRPRVAALVAAAPALFALLAALIVRHRVGVVASYTQFRGGFGLTPLWQTATFGAALGLGAVWTAGAVHLLWSVRHKL